MKNNLKKIGIALLFVAAVLSFGLYLFEYKRTLDVEQIKDGELKNALQANEQLKADFQAKGDELANALQANEQLKSNLQAKNEELANALKANEQLKADFRAKVDELTNALQASERLKKVRDGELGKKDVEITRLKKIKGEYFHGKYESATKKYTIYLSKTGIKMMRGKNKECDAFTSLDRATETEAEFFVCDSYLRNNLDYSNKIVFKELKSGKFKIIFDGYVIADDFVFVKENS